MSDNDDLLNYELGEDLDEHALLAGDEDELLLSDDDLERDVSSEQRDMLKDEAEEWVKSNLKPTKKERHENSGRKTEDQVTTTSSCVKNAPEKVSTELQAESDVSTSEKAPVVEEAPHAQELVEAEQTAINDEVSSTNKENEDSPSVAEAQVAALPHQEAEVLPASQESSAATDMSMDPQEECEERERFERTNIKQTVERDNQSDSSPEKFHPRFPGSKRGRGGPMMRGGHFPGSRPPVRYPHANYPQYPQHPNENVNPQAPPHNYPPYGPMDPQQQMNPRQPFPPNNQMPPRMEYRPQMGPHFRPQNPNEFNMFRGPRHDFPNHMNGAPFNSFAQPNMRPMFRPDGSQLPPQGQHMRPRMPLHRPPGMPSQNNPNYMNSAMASQQPPQQHGSQHPGNMTIIAHPQLPNPNVQQPVIPRKVLINPNFKGGVEAATSQLMKDTQFMQAISSHLSHLQSDEELLRQQEEFINKNRIHIEKRRYERSPDRSRERSYSPPRRERRADSRERRAGSRGRTRRAGSREFDARHFPKRRRSASIERRREKDKIHEEEDEETRIYRQEIEKQKAMREKILRDKEMRRRRAAEEKIKEEEKQPPNPDEPPAKLKPIIVTESKIISLKKKGEANQQAIANSKLQAAGSQHVSAQHHQTIQRAIPTAKILPEAKRQVATEMGVKDASTGMVASSKAAMAVIKPVVKTITVQTDLLDEDELLEEERLLADTPSPPSSPAPLSNSHIHGSRTQASTSSLLMASSTLSDKTLGSSANSSSSNVGLSNSNTNASGNAFISSNRRVVLKSSLKDVDSAAMSATSDVKKGIFDRLEKKIGVNEAVKRKIQRIVIKNAERN